MGGIKIKGTGFCVPKRVMTNKEFLDIIDTDEEWIVSRTGIEHRHYVDNEKLSDLCKNACCTALERAGVAPEEIGVCIVGTHTADNLVPSAACELQRDLQLPHECICFDLSSACTGFLYALHTTECLLARSPKRYGLVVGAEALSRLLNWEDRSTCILFGDGAGAVVVEFDESYNSIHAVLGCSGSDKILHVRGVGPGKKSVIYMNGQPVFKFALKASLYCTREVLERTGTKVEDIDFFVFHQANARIIDLIVKKYHIPPEKYYKNIAEYGNTAAASIPIVIGELWEKKKISSHSRILCIGFGGGLTWGGALLELS